MWIFTAASVACAIAPVSGLLIAGRCCRRRRGPARTDLTRACSPPPIRTARRGTGTGFWAGVAGVAFRRRPGRRRPAGVRLSWRAVFWINVPIAVVGVLLTAPARCHRRQGVREPADDPVGQVLAIVGLACVAGALNEASTTGWTSALVLTLFAVGALALVAFAW